MQPKIRHIVSFCLKHEKGSPQAAKFIADSKAILGGIPNVAVFDQCEQVSPKNDFDYVFVFDFMSEADYAAYNAHPAHVQYVRERWDTEVARFQETDLKEL
ncbi:MAG TPA: stress responsive protein [Clostridiales bacterium]|nr:stress responsive protein [Clostridiales bacterium]